jgi:hypothetical protein
MRDERNIERKKEREIGRREGGEEGDRGKRVAGAKLRSTREVLLRGKAQYS